ncbi:DUF3000 domain-containing protein [Nesterenkonia flava]|uniref:DUF3000 domain-containing protein n=1 Tax=Nesterenkonia flava TaxID=469799 RepID=A0ABU1FUQ6_9MICC|nr:DUF3000 domain-containing protein [Nesterenkonia flava]MDR5712400.1 DUF3000 domain-containing protein [Nesterenkonia flava]
MRTPSIDGLPQSFLAALGELRRARPRGEALVEEVPAPAKLAPYAVALRAEIHAPGVDVIGAHPVARLRPTANEEEILATGRFILLHDPAGQEAWGGTFRVVIYIRAELEPEMGNDPLLASVAWTWLSDSLGQHGVEYTRAGGTATRILSESFGSLESRQASNDVELRASWTPSSAHVGAHLEAWADMVCSFAGLPPLPDGVVALPHIRRS